MSTVIKNGTVVTADLTYEADVLVENGVITEIGKREDAPGHTFIDYGDDEYTQGRAHPMIDQTVRLDRLADAAALLGEQRFDEAAAIAAEASAAESQTLAVPKKHDTLRRTRSRSNSSAPRPANAGP